MTGAAFVGAVGAVLLTLVLARGVEQTLRLLLAGVVVGVVLGSGSALLTLMNPDIMRAMQAFMLGSTGYVGWSAVQIMATALVLCMLVALGCSRMLDALSLGEATARSLGVRLPLVRLLLIATLALATGAAVAQCGLVALAPHLVRSWGAITHRGLLLLAPLAGGMLLLAADIGARWVIAPQELPVGIITALLGGSYLLYLMHRRNARGGAR
jgi:iron complex transport system permease protein